MAFTFQQYGTFTGPGSQFIYRDNDDFSVTADVPFNLPYVGCALVNSVADYVALHLAGTSTSNVFLEASYGPIPNFTVNAVSTKFTGQVTAAANVTAPTFTGTLLGFATGNKAFDIPHPNKSGWRLRHTCLEGPENGVYVRGRLTNSNIIELPDYWVGLVDAESITVSLTQIGYSQDLIVEKIEWGKKIFIKSGTGSNIDCYYVVNGTRKNTETLIPEYQGTTPADYPGDNTQYSVAGFHYDVRLS
jgi:hypothetical protein